MEPDGTWWFVWAGLARGPFDTQTDAASALDSILAEVYGD